MKKIFVFICAVTIVSSMFTGCGSVDGGNETPAATINVKDESEAHLKNAYNNLVSANSELEKVASSVQSAWHYGIFEDNLSFSGLSSKTGVSKSELENSGVSEFLLNDFSSCVSAVVLAYQANGTFSNIKSDLDSAKSEIQSATDDLDNYNDMKNYYSSCLAYYEWLQSPDGNFDQATDTINSYNSELKEYKNDMEFDYGE